MHTHLLYSNILVDMHRLIQNGFPIKIWQYAWGNCLAADHLALFLVFFPTANTGRCKYQK